MTSLVLDAATTLAAVLPERHSETARTILLRVAESGAVVPAIWHLEIGNILLAAERRGILLAAQREEILERLSVLSITTDQETAPRAWSDTIKLARDYGLSLHDAAYLELALRRGVPLATFDAVLLRAAGAVGVKSGSVG
jgi:predicted nucleic acid-binding protein